MMVAQRPRELLQRLDPRAQGPSGPAVKEPRRRRHGPVAPEPLEVFLEKVGADGLEIDGDEVAQPRAFAAAKVLGSLEQQPPRLGPA